MQHQMPGLLLFVLLFLPAPPCAASTNLPVSKFVVIYQAKSWFVAQNYCRTEHTDLVTIRTESEAQELDSFHGWIGLRRGSDGMWKWSKGDETPSYFHGDFLEQVAEPNGEDCVYVSHQHWDNRDCDDSYPFLCVDERLILVREMKTWEDALIHCNRLQAAENTSHQYTLATRPESQHAYLDRETIKQGAETEEVWVALRFLAGKWMWVPGGPPQASYLPQCPTQQKHCGALVRSQTGWRTLDCAEKRNFLCSPRH